ncbi:MAG: hypothetical protein RIA69_09505 [Cyclobacteriaceae bacterium]
MKKNIIQLFCILILLVSCEKNCEDCGSSSSKEYYIENKKEIDENIKWFGFVTFSSNLAHEINLAPQERVLLYRGDKLGSSGVLGSPPFNDNEREYDSVQFEFIDQSMLFVKGDCENAQNPLCEKNQELVKNIETKD